MLLVGAVSFIREETVFELPDYPDFLYHHAFETDARSQIRYAHLAGGCLTQTYGMEIRLRLITGVMHFGSGIFQKEGYA